MVRYSPWLEAQRISWVSWVKQRRQTWSGHLVEEPRDVIARGHEMALAALPELVEELEGVRSLI